MGSYQGLCADIGDEIFQYRFGKCESIIGSGSATKLIKDDETFFARIVQNICDFDHFCHKGRLVFCNNISTTDTRKNCIYES
jgi:hypothetical protein